MITHEKTQFPSLSEIKICDSFWTPYLKKAQEITLPDILKMFENDGCFKNFDSVAEGKREKHATMPWSDGLVYETLSAACDMLIMSYDSELADRLSGYVSRICAAADADKDGFLSTYTITDRPERRFGENGGMLLWQHDLYNCGCLFEAAVHYYTATGKITLLKAACRLADYLCSYIGEPPKKNIVPGHSMAEYTLISLYKLLKGNKDLADLLSEGENKRRNIEDYLTLAEFWITHRGDHRNRASFPHSMLEYAQDDKLLLTQDEAVGHAVRATLLYTGLTSAANENGNAEYADAAHRIWNNVTKKKMYISGGIGSRHADEKFGYEYELPNDGYLETCAGVALAFWAGEMYKLDGKADKIDILERVLYNNVIPSVSESGNLYFYENPLVDKDGKAERWSHHVCPCCPPMYLKLISSLPSYIYAYSNSTLSVNLRIDSTLSIAEFRGKPLSLSQKDGVITLNSAPSGEYTVRVRIPEYASGVSVSLCGSEINAKIENGFAYVTRKWCDGDTLCVSYKEEIRKNIAHPCVEADKGRVAITKGTILYCAEGIDNDGDVDFTVKASSALSFNQSDRTIIGESTDGRSFKLIPYYKWCNRGKTKMAVWLKYEGLPTDDYNLDGWDNLLYKQLTD